LLGSSDIIKIDICFNMHLVTNFVAMQVHIETYVKFTIRNLTAATIMLTLFKRKKHAIFTALIVTRSEKTCLIYIQILTTFSEFEVSKNFLCT